MPHAIQIKTIIRYIANTLIRLEIFLRNLPNVGENLEKLELCFTAVENALMLVTFPSSQTVSFDSFIIN